MRRPYWNAHAHHTAVFGVELARFELKFGAVEFQGYVGGSGKPPAHRADSCRHGGAALQKIAAVPPRSCGTEVGHQALHCLLFLNGALLSSVFPRATISPNRQVSLMNAGLGSRPVEPQRGRQRWLRDLNSRCTLRIRAKPVVANRHCSSLERRQTVFTGHRGQMTNGRQTSSAVHEPQQGIEPMHRLFYSAGACSLAAHVILEARRPSTRTGSVCRRKED
jgi:hypothetical protein